MTDKELIQEGADGAIAAGFLGRRADVYAEAFVDAMTGHGEFWSPTAWDYNVKAADILRDACQLIGATSAARWAYVEGGLSALAHEFALLEAEK